MSDLRRLLRFVRPYSAPLLLSVVLMAAVGAGQGFMAVLIGPIFDRVLKPDSADSLVPLVTVPGFSHTIYLQDILPASIHNVWTMVAVAILATFLIKGLCDYFGNYMVNYVGFAAVTDLRQKVFDRVLRQDATFFESNSTGRLMSSIMNDLEKIQVALSGILGMAGRTRRRHVMKKMARAGWLRYFWMPHPIILCSDSLRRMKRKMM